MAKNIRVDDEYTNRARKEGYLARSIYKLQQINEKYTLFDNETKRILDIWCAPGSWLQFAHEQLANNPDIPEEEKILIWFDIKDILYSGIYARTYQQDITDRVWVKQVFEELGIPQLDCIISDMAPDTMWRADIDALRSVGLIEKTLWIYEDFLKEWGKFAIKVFMWPGFEELVRELKDIYGNSAIVTYKPKACRKQSKETFIIKRS